MCRERRSLKNLVDYIIKIQHFKELEEVVGVLDQASKVRQQLYTTNNDHCNR